LKKPKKKPSKQIKFEGASLIVQIEKNFFHHNQHLDFIQNMYDIKGLL